MLGEHFSIHFKDRMGLLGDKSQFSVINHFNSHDSDISGFTKLRYSLHL
jgi:hypothetical protein